MLIFLRYTFNSYPGLYTHPQYILSRCVFYFVDNSFPEISSRDYGCACNKPTQGRIKHQKFAFYVRQRVSRQKDGLISFGKPGYVHIM